MALGNAGHCRSMLVGRKCAALLGLARAGSCGRHGREKLVDGDVDGERRYLRR